MKRMLLVWFFTLAACAIANPGRAADKWSIVPHSDAPVDEAIFKTLDIDGDGYVSRLEARRETNLKRMFDELDTNRDGRLSRDELKGLYVVEMPGDAANRKATGQSR